jgi:hypothetical protein
MGELATIARLNGIDGRMNVFAEVIEQLKSQVGVALEQIAEIRVQMATLEKAIVDVKALHGMNTTRITVPPVPKILRDIGLVAPAAESEGER